MYGIMRLSKLKKNQIQGVFYENCRTLEDHKNGREFPNSDIDWERTNDNLYLVKSTNWHKTINQMLEKYSIGTVRKDATILIDTVYACTPDFWADKTLEEVKEYFQACLEFHKKAYGDYIINAVIHVDEGVKEYEFENELGEIEKKRVPTYHMHCQSLPIKERTIPGPDGQSNKIYSLCARDIIGDKKSLSQHQSDFFETVSSLWNLDRIKQNPEIQRKHLSKLEWENQQMKIASDKCKAELNIRSRVLEACQEPVEIEVLSQSRFKKEPTSTVRTEDLERLKRQVKTAKDLEKGLSELNRIAKETIAISSTDEKIIELNEVIREHTQTISSLKLEIANKQQEITTWKSKYNQMYNQLQEDFKRWFNMVKEFLTRRNIFKEFEFYITHETQEIKEREIELTEDITRN